MVTAPEPPLGILAAGGRLPAQVARAALAAGRDVFIVGLEGVADQEITTFPHATVKWGQIGRIFQMLSERGIGDVVLIGAVDARPDFKGAGFDVATIRLMPKILKALSGGDDSVLGSVLRIVEDEGFRVVGAHEVAPRLVAQAGPVAGPAGLELDEDAKIAFEAAAAIGRLDIGQGTVAVDGRIIAVEAAEGTDDMIARVKRLRLDGRVLWNGRRWVLAKRAKPEQDLRIDMPTIGPRTVEAVAEAGLAGIVIEAQRVMIAERDVTERLASKTGTCIRAASITP